MEYKYIPKSCNLQLLNSLALFIKAAKKFYSIFNLPIFALLSAEHNDIWIWICIFLRSLIHLIEEKYRFRILNTADTT